MRVRIDLADTRRRRTAEWRDVPRYDWGGNRSGEVTTVMQYSWLLQGTSNAILLADFTGYIFRSVLHYFPEWVDIALSAFSTFFEVTHGLLMGPWLVQQRFSWTRARPFLRSSVHRAGLYFLFRKRFERSPSTFYWHVSWNKTHARHFARLISKISSSLR